jgi:hypothetical protein
MFLLGGWFLTVFLLDGWFLTVFLLDGWFLTAFLLDGWFLTDSAARLSTLLGHWSLAARHAPSPILLGTWLLANSVGRLLTPPGGYSLAVGLAPRYERSSLRVLVGWTRRLATSSLRSAIRTTTRDLVLSRSRPPRQWVRDRLVMTRPSQPGVPDKKAPIGTEPESDISRT